MTDLLREIEEAAVVDFESDPIRARPDFPPIPCGVAIKYGAAPARYYAWGHRGHANPDGYEAGRAARGAAWESGRPLLFHNAKFDLAVAEERMGLPRPPWARVHDTLPALFLLDPRAPTYSLKPSAHKLLGLAPEERDAVVDWLMGKQPVPGVRLSRAHKSDSYAGAFVAWAPPDVVGPYCVGDVDRTRALGLWASERLTLADMVGAYDRERRLLPVIMDMEARGVRVNVVALERDLAAAETALMELDGWILARLGASAADFINLDSGDELASLLVLCGAATEASLGVTPKSGKLQTNKEAFDRGVFDPQLKAALRWRAALQVATQTFMAPWLDTARRAGGRIYTTWNSTRVSHDAGHADAGARTGRFSSTPNFQNIPKEVKPLFRGDDPADPRDAERPSPPFALLKLPRVRGYVLPEEGHALVGRDFASQELRVLAHFEDDALFRAYHERPDLDLHQYVTDTLAARGHKMTRRLVKNLHFAVIYGVGIGHLAEMMDCSVVEARAVLDAYYHEFPSVRELADETKRRWRTGQPVRTWGGRVYPPEPPRIIDGRLRRWEYKALNVIVQGSSADLTKEAMIAYAEVDGGRAPLILTVHDELVVTAPAAERDAAMTRLRDAMNVDRLDVPMRSDGYVGANWDDKIKLKDEPLPPKEDDRPPGGPYGPWVKQSGAVGTNTKPPFQK